MLFNSYASFYKNEYKLLIMKVLQFIHLEGYFEFTLKFVEYSSIRIDNILQQVRNKWERIDQSMFRIDLVVPFVW